MTRALLARAVTTTVLLFAVVASPALAQPAPLRLAHDRDFNGDGTTDVLWRNSVDGSLAMWLMDRLTILGSQHCAVLPQWTVVRTPDFDGDGRSDIPWRNTAINDTAIWLMNGPAVLASAAWFVTGANCA